MDSSLMVLDAFAVLLQFGAAYFGYKIYRSNKLSKWWLALILAFLLQGIRRVFTLNTDIVLSTITPDIILDRLLQFIISALICIGLWSMKENFRKFDAVSKKLWRAFS